MLPSELIDCDKEPVWLNQPAFQNRELIDIGLFAAESVVGLGASVPG
ncbi:hypothetical protein NCCP602_34650 [Brevibacterium metallidurans]|uniref:Uncharacterized protein n=1 Tax=Brevibacterium metallidurans TaxID=1482676 RepID=A0ABP3CC73_9MICO